MQMHLLSDRIQKSILTLLLFAVGSCSTISERSNKNFIKKYQKDVSRINSKRNDPLRIDPSSFDPNRNWKESIEIFNFYESTETVRTARIDTSKIKLPDPPDEVFPSMKTFLDGRMRDLPDDMFHVSYNPHNFPHSYGRPKLSFDDISMPSRDAFGVQTALGEKNYQLINHKTLQRDIDFVKKNRDLQDDQISAELILEQKQSKRRKYLEQRNVETSNAKYVLSGKSQISDNSQTKNVPKNAISKTILKTQIIEKMSAKMNQDVKKELSEEEKKALIMKYQKDVENMVKEMNSQTNQNKPQNLATKEKRDLQEKEMLEMVLEIQKIIFKDMKKRSSGEDSLR
jgi:hypothetical protein